MKKEKMPSQSVSSRSILTTSPCIYAGGNNYELRIMNYELERSDLTIPPEQLEICLNVLQQISDDPAIINQHDRFKSLIAKIYKQGRKGLRQTQQHQQQTEDRKLRASTAIVQHQQKLFIPLPESTSSAIAISGPIIHSVHNSPQLNQPILCYICKRPYTQLHSFYHSLCPSCAELNYQKRQQRTSLVGRVALVTGGRIKIGYQMGLRLLCCKHFWHFGDSMVNRY